VERGVIINRPPKFHIGNEENTMKIMEANGARIPALGFAVFRMSDHEIERVVPVALDAGLRHFDTAQIYGNEAALGRALKLAGIPRDELFLTTKVWCDNYSPVRFASSVDESLDRLGVDQVDLLLLHWPGNSVPISEQIEMLNAVHAAGRTRHVGVSNQNVSQMAESVRISVAPIVTNQVEIHPYLDQSRLMAAAASWGVAATAYYGMADGAVPRDDVLHDIGRRYGLTAAQVALRWLVQQEVVALTKTARPERVAENAAIFDFVLSDDDMDRIAGLSRANGRLVSPDGLAPDWNS
jgi:2,5-diketo-D-gluconate reductase B